MSKCNSTNPTNQTLVHNALVARPISAFKSLEPQVPTPKLIRSLEELTRSLTLYKELFIAKLEAQLRSMLGDNFDFLVVEECFTPECTVMICFKSRHPAKGEMVLSDHGIYLKVIDAGVEIRYPLLPQVKGLWDLGVLYTHEVKIHATSS